MTPLARTTWAIASGVAAAWLASTILAAAWLASRMQARSLVALVHATQVPVPAAVSLGMSVIAEGFAGWVAARVARSGEVLHAFLAGLVFGATTCLLLLPLRQPLTAPYLESIALGVLFAIGGGLLARAMRERRIDGGRAGPGECEAGAPPPSSTR